MAAHAEQRRLEEARAQGVVPWRRWGPYLSERQWGTVREDYSPDGSAWEYFPHDHARSRAYHWGEDGLAGISDEGQRLCLAVALWNGRDPFLKERLFGLTASEGNHGEDVKEYYFYLDATPTHAYMKYLYKYPQRAFPYADLVGENRRRGPGEPEYELLDTGVFDDDRYFDVTVEYAKVSPGDVLVQIRADNRGPDTAPLHVLPTLWFRNRWAWGAAVPRPSLRRADAPPGQRAVAAFDAETGEHVLWCEGEAALLFTENETNTRRLSGAPNPTPYVKDGINDAVVLGRADAVNPEQAGTKAAAHYVLQVAGGGAATLRLRLRDAEAPAPADARLFGPAFEAILAERRAEADDFYDTVLPASLGPDARSVARQALGGLLWSKQFYNFELPAWLTEHARGGAGRRRGPRWQWFHLRCHDIVSVPDRWEYPWCSAWDVAFHAVALALTDVDFAKQQITLVLNERYQHPSGQLPASERSFDEVTPPVHAWAALWVYQHEKAVRGRGDLDFLARVFRKLLLHFTWWVNRKDPGGGPEPIAGPNPQTDGIAWTAFFSQSMLQMAIELASEMPSYEDLIPKFVEHFLLIAAAMDYVGERQDEMWDETDGFFYDVVRLPDGRAERLRIRSLVGLLPLCATVVIPREAVERFPDAVQRLREFVAEDPTLTRTIAPPGRPGVHGRRLLALLDENRLRRVLARMLDEAEFLGAYGIRSLSRHHRDHPYVVTVDASTLRVQYEPAESAAGPYAGNTNWRGPIWFPLNVLIIRALIQLYAYYGDGLTVECPTGSGKQRTLFEVAREITDRLARIFLRDEAGRRPVHGTAEKFQTDPHWRDHVLFYEYFHPDDGRGFGASHHTGWTALIAPLLAAFAGLGPGEVLDRDTSALAPSPDGRH
jgi:hypothetical protein